MWACIFRPIWAAHRAFLTLGPTAYPPILLGRLNFTIIHRRLADGLAEFSDNEYDLVLIDCPPNFNIVTKTAIIASGYLLVPARPDYLSTLGIEYSNRLRR
jgi:cellulose biosynthesis protein BcsQ